MTERKTQRAHVSVAALLTRIPVGLLDVLRPSSVSHPVLGVLHRTWGKWRGQIQLPGSPSASLLVPGPRSGPDPRAVALVAELPLWYPDLQPEIGQRLRAHYRPYWDAAARHGTSAPDADLPRLLAPGDVWAEVVHMSVEVAPYAARDEILISYGLAWTDRHVVGALIRDWRLIAFLGEEGD